VDAGIPVIDLSLIEGVPTLEQVLDVVASELELDSAITPSELPGADAACDAAVAAALDGKKRKEVMYEQVKVLAKHARAVVRTGDCRPYASIILLAAGL
jgi:D-ribose pyranase